MTAHTASFDRRQKRIDTHAELQYLVHFVFAFRINRKTFIFGNSLQSKITLLRILEWIV
jgi:hypothetical protein